MQLLLQIFVLVFSFDFIFLWQNTLLKGYTTPLIIILMISYLILAARKGGKGFLNLGGEGPLGIFILNSLIFILLFSTGAINSPLFPLLFFLSLGIACIFSPMLVFIFAIGTLLILMPELFKGDILSNVLKVSSVFFASLLAFFLEQQFLRSEENAMKVKTIKEYELSAANAISKDIKKIITNNKQPLDKANSILLNEALKEANNLRKEAK
jgi:hypothetical protein